MRTLLQPQSLLMKIDKLIIGATIADSSLELTSSSFYPPFSDAYSERCQTSKTGPSELWGRRCICSPITFSHVIKVSFFFIDKGRWWTVLLEEIFQIFDIFAGNSVKYSGYPRPHLVNLQHPLRPYVICTGWKLLNALYMDFVAPPKCEASDPLTRSMLQR